MAINDFQFKINKTKISDSWYSLKKLESSSDKIKEYKLVFNPDVFYKDLIVVSLTEDKELISTVGEYNRDENTYSIYLPNLPEEFIPFTKVVPILYCENGIDAYSINQWATIIIWEKYGTGHKMKFFTRGAYGASTFIDLKLYIYNPRDYYGLQKNKE